MNVVKIVRIEGGVHGGILKCCHVIDVETSDLSSTAYNRWTVQTSEPSCQTSGYLKYTISHT